MELGGHLSACGHAQANTKIAKTIENARRRLNNNWRQPFTAETVSLKHSVVRNNPQFFYAGLGDEHSVEWVPVHGRETTGC